MPRRRFIRGLCVFLALAVLVVALAYVESVRAESASPSSGGVPTFIEAYVADARLVGQSRLSVFVWDVYDAFLYAPGGVWGWDRPFALTLSYLRALKGHAIAERSIEEIQGLGFTDEATLDQWRDQMRDLFPNVDDGSSLTGIYVPDRGSVFFHNGREIGQIDDPRFGRWFFGIWLNEKTSEPDMRRELLGAP